MKNIPEELSAYFKSLGITQESIAERLGVSQQYVSLMLGHSSGNPVTRIYIREDMAKADRAMRAVIDLVNGTR